MCIRDRCINRLEEHQEGEIIVDGTELTEDTKNIEQIRAEVGMVFQQFNLFPHLSILDNCSLAPIWVRKLPKAEAKEKAMEYLKRVQIDDQAHKYPAQLSGGQQQRAALLRAILMKPKILLLDEPFSNLDKDNIIAAQKIIRQIISLYDIPCLLISHDIQSTENFQIDKEIIIN